MARFLLEMADRAACISLSAPGYSGYSRVSQFLLGFLSAPKSGTWLLPVLQKNCVRCETRNRRYSGEMCSCRERPWWTCLCVVYTFISIWKKKANEHEGRKQDPSLVIPGPQQDPTPLCGCEVISLQVLFSPLQN